MKLTSLHLLLTYKCTLACDHCFVWGSPYQKGTMTLATVNTILEQAKDLETIKSIYFEGGEPFLCYSLLIASVRETSRQGFQSCIVSNGYWANSVKVAIEKLRPLAGQLSSLTISSDLYHWDKRFKNNYLNALTAAKELGIPIDVIEINPPETSNQGTPIGQIPAGTSGVMYRGRAAEKLVIKSAKHPWEQFTHCPYENLHDPGRVHLDPLGHVHICQGISMGNILQTSLKEIWETYDPDRHPIVGPINRGGPAELCHIYGLPHEQQYADACHLCYRTREALRPQFPEILAPDQMYGLFRSSQSKEARHDHAVALPKELVGGQGIQQPMG